MIEQVTPRLPSPQLHFKNTPMKSTDQKSKNSSRRKIVNKNDVTLNNSNHSFVQQKHSEANKNDLKGFLESSIPKKRKNQLYAIETMENVNKNSLDKSDEEIKSLRSHKSESFTNNSGKHKRMQSQKYDYQVHTPGAKVDCSQSPSNILHPSTRVENREQNKSDLDANSSDTTEKKGKESSRSKVSYSKERVLNYQENSISPIPQIQ